MSNPRILRKGVLKAFPQYYLEVNYGGYCWCSIQKEASKTDHFDPAGLNLEVNDYVVVETTGGVEMGQVVIAPRQVLGSSVERPLKPVVRKAEPEDVGGLRNLRLRKGRLSSRY